MLATYSTPSVSTSALGTAAELERRRKQAVQAVADGEPRKTVAMVFGVHIKTVSHWVNEGPS